MFHRWCSNNKITHLHERCLRIIYSDKSSSYKELLERNGSVSINLIDIQAIAIEIFQNLNGMFPEITNDLFVQRKSLQSLSGKWL